MPSSRSVANQAWHALVHSFSITCSLAIDDLVCIHIFMYASNNSVHLTCTFCRRFNAGTGAWWPSRKLPSCERHAELRSAQILREMWVIHVCMNDTTVECIHTYTCIYIYIYVCMYIYMYIYMEAFYALRPSPPSCGIASLPIY
jgi:hypothetical protein